LFEKKLLHFLEIVELAVSEAWWTISFIAINTEIAVFITCNDSFASEALAGGVLCVLSNHALLVLATLCSMSFDALEL
jgi:hypothetical protein